MTRHVLKITDLSRLEVLHILRGATALKHAPHRYASALQSKTLLMLFQKPSLRTRLSFEAGMTQLGGHAIYYDTGSKQSTVGANKETISDTAQTASRYVDVIMARLTSRSEVRELAQFATVPVINGLDDFAHPCQILADLLTIQHAAQLEDLKKLKMTYVGDIANNVTYDLMRAAHLLGFNLRLGGPDPNKFGEQFAIEKEVLEEVAGSSGSIKVMHNAQEAVEDADVVYTDSWMSYHLDPTEKENRMKALDPFRVTSELMSKASEEAIFMHCLPAQRGMEVTAGVIDGRQSIVFDQAENRLHAQKALIMFLLGKLD
jgi:ornithine carbamoyltransferase